MEADVMKLLLDAGTGGQPVVSVAIMVMLWKQFQLHREERERWNQRFDKLSVETTAALKANAAALEAFRTTLEAKSSHA